MTWVLGYALQPKFATKYAIARGCRCQLEEPNPDFYYRCFAAKDIKHRSGLANHDSPLLGCWVNFEPRTVFTLYVDRESKTKREADERLDPRRLPPVECVEKLYSLLRAKGPPKWYRYLDDDWSPKEVERYERRLAANAAREAQTVADEREPTDDGEETLESGKSGSVASQEEISTALFAEP